MMNKTSFLALLNADKETAMEAELRRVIERDVPYVTIYFGDKELSTHRADHERAYTALDTYASWLRHWRAMHSAVEAVGRAAPLQMNKRRPFTVILTNDYREAYDPMIIHVEAASAADLPGAIAETYLDDYYDSSMGEKPGAEAFFRDTCARVLAITEGHQSFLWNVNGCGAHEYSVAFEPRV